MAQLYRDPKKIKRINLEEKKKEKIPSNPIKCLTMTFVYACSLPPLGFGHCLKRY